MLESTMPSFDEVTLLATLLAVVIGLLKVNIGVKGGLLLPQSSCTVLLLVVTFTTAIVLVFLLVPLLG